MRVLPEFLIMDTKPGYCAGSSGRLMNQYMIKDHMVSHYRKLYSAKAAVDCSAPKSMQSSVKYVDQKRREQFRSNTRSHSGRPDSQRSTRINSRTSCSSNTSRPSVQGDDRFLDQSLPSSARISTSFHSKQIVYPSQTIPNPLRSASELSSRSPKRGFKSFQDPTQKTYSGDVLQKHAHRFTAEKAFTPRTLKSQHSATLLQYRYYTPPRRKASAEDTHSKEIPQETLLSTRSKPGFSPQIESPQPLTLNQEWSDGETDSFRLHSKTNRFRDSDFLLSSSRVSPEGMRSPIMRKVSAEEEELLYLEFITDVTNEILAQGLYSDRVLKRVFERHIDMNRHRLDENKMRHLLNNLQDDLQSPPSASIRSAEQSHNPLQLRNKASNPEPGDEPYDEDDLLQRVFHQAASPVPQSIMESDLEEKSQISLNNELFCSLENPGNAGDADEELGQVDELGKIMAQSLTVSENDLKEDLDVEKIKQDASDDEF